MIFKNSKQIFCNLNLLVCVCIKVCLYACVCVCGWVWIFCTLDVVECHPFTAVYFFLESWLICRLYRQKFREFLCFCKFPIHFLWVGHFWPKTTSVTLFVYDHLACSDHDLKFFLYSHTKCQKSHQVSQPSDEAVIFKNSKQKIIRSEMTEDHQRVK